VVLTVRRSPFFLGVAALVLVAAGNSAYALCPAWDCNKTYNLNDGASYNGTDYKNTGGTMGAGTLCAYPPSTYNWWSVGAGNCSGGATATKTPTKTATPTATATSGGGATATRTNTATATATTSGGGSISQSAWYQVKNVNSGKCVDAAGNNTANGTVVQQWTCYNNAAQQFQFVATDSGYYKVVNRNSTAQGWDVNGGTGATGDLVKVQLWNYTGGTNQQWLPVSEGGSNYHFVARHSGKCLDVNAASTADGVQLQQYTCNNSGAQSFTMTSQAAAPTVVPPPAATATTAPAGGIGSIVSSGQFDQIWNPATRSSTYTYADFKTAADSYYPALCGTGDTNTRKRECAAYFASKDQETGMGQYDRELYCQPGGGGYGGAACNYCGGSSCGACAAGQQYWGRHAVQLSWDYNYCLASGQVGTNLHADPNAIFNNRVTGWRLSDWYWMTQLGPSVSNGYGTWPMKTAHDAITTTDGSGNYGFGGTIRAVNGGIECGSRVQQQINRVTYYNGSGGDEEDSSGGTLGVLGYAGGIFGRRFCSP
jgi:chitinase